MNRVQIRKILRGIVVLNCFIYDIAIGISVLIVGLIIFNQFTEYDWSEMYLFYDLYVPIYLAIIFVLALINTYHRFKWYIRSSPIKIPCSKCHSTILAKRFQENRWLTAPKTLYVETIRFQFIRIKQYFYLTVYRPFLEIECPECHEQQVICPYCHEPISEESVECYFDKPSTCPHCGKKVYSPLPLMDSEHLIKIKDIDN